MSAAPDNEVAGKWEDEGQVVHYWVRFLILETTTCQLYFCNFTVMSIQLSEWFVANPSNNSKVQYSTVQFSTVQCSTVQYGTVQYSTLQYIELNANLKRTVLYNVYKIF